MSYYIHSMEQIKWIGFDMDDCIANVTPAYMFVKEIGAAKAAALLLESDRAGKTWLLRSGIQKIVDEVSKAVSEKKVYGAFLYSNNGSENMVEFVRIMLNHMATPKNLNPFKAGFHRKFVARTGHRLKTYEDLCNCLHIVDLPLPSSPECLAFFDDKEQVLSSEIKLYRRVRRYRGYTPVQHIADVLKDHMTEEAFSKAYLQASHEEFQREEKLHPRLEQNTHVFIDTIQKLSKVE